MAHVSGPCSTLPGSLHKTSEGMTCDDCSQPATKRIQGETDSFGAEYADYCDACYGKVKLAMAEHAEEDRTGCCDWCKQYATDLRNRRDYEEGSCGPVYRVCGACVKRENDEATAELEASGYFDNDYDDYDPTDDAWCDDSWDEDVSSASNMHAPVIVSFDAEGNPPGGYPRAYVDGQFIY